GEGPWESISLYANSTVSNSIVYNDYAYGIAVWSGNPLIKNTTITGTNASEDGIAVYGGNPTIDSSNVKGFTNGGRSGVSVSGGAPVISNSIIDQNDTGISIAVVSPTVTNNTITNNLTGVAVTQDVTTAPTINYNNIFCNSDSDLNVSVITAVPAIDVSNNSWDHAPPVTASPGAFPCPTGTDICFTGLPPVFTGYAIVPSPCP
ncbi:MAG TPA: right-handed parallel beta-helix repeat-containing protein, partial [Nitrospirota bacterium]|nr:right-handed parallel beta-helix repeat-containing protein [Nitrospirota bacterium]